MHTMLMLLLKLLLIQLDTEYKGMEIITDARAK